MGGGLYNMLMGHNPALPYLLGIVGITQQNAHLLGRLRDAWISADGTRIFVLHRNYGPEGEAADAEAAKLPGYVGKTLDVGDCTYGHYEYAVPQDDEKLAAFARSLAKQTDNTPCMERYRKLIEDMKADKDTPEVKHALDVGKQIFAGLDQAMKTGGQVDVGGVSIQSVNPENPGA